MFEILHNILWNLKWYKTWYRNAVNDKKHYWWRMLVWGFNYRFVLLDRRFEYDLYLFGVPIPFFFGMFMWVRRADNGNVAYHSHGRGVDMKPNWTIYYISKSDEWHVTGAMVESAAGTLKPPMHDSKNSAATFIRAIHVMNKINKMKQDQTMTDGG